MSWPLLAQVAAPAAEATAMSPQSAIAWAIALLILSAGLAIVEFLVVSWGMLLVGAAVSSIAAIALAFHAHPMAGWIFVVIVPVLFVFIIRSGFGLMRRNSAAVLPTEITADAGIRHQAAQAGVAVGALGELVTNAFPTGRARFGGTGHPVELDVQVQGAVLSRGDRVVVLAIDGAVISVGAARDTVSGLLETNTNNPQGSPHA
jgi:membrane-bound ClpP family serine protease